MIVQEPVQAAIWHCLNHYAYPDAIFLAERLFSEVDSEETLFLLATCYYRSGKVKQAQGLLSKRSLSSPQCKFLLAKCCYDLEKFAEAEAALIGGYYKQLKNFDEIVAQFGDEACFCLQILAKICYKMTKTAKGNEAHKLALKLNPFLWHSFEELCNTGEKVDAEKLFQLDKLESLSTCIGSTPITLNIQEPELIVPSALNTPTSHNLNLTPIQGPNNLISGIRLHSLIDESPQHLITNINYCSTASPRAKPPRFRSMFSNSMSPLTPSFGVLPLDMNTPEPPVVSNHTTLTEANDQKGLAKRVSSLKAHVGQLISRKETPLQQGKLVFSQSGNTSNTANIVTVTPTTPIPSQPALQGPNVRRSSRLFSHSYSVKENNKSPNRSKFTTPKSPLRKNKTRLAKNNLKTSFNEMNEKNKNEKEKSETITSENIIANTNALNQSNSAAFASPVTIQKNSAEGLMSLLRQLGTAYQNLCQFNCTEAVEILTTLPGHHYNTGWVLSMLAKAHFEMIDYKKAASYFAQVRTLEPHRTELMEIYSTTLWHLPDEVQLSTLAQDLVAEDRNSAATWCAVGNLFSAQTEHETAIKFLHRAIQVNPNFPYAHNLLGHEYVITEELDKAMTAFRNAIRLDPRHYNAWFGLGTIFAKQELFTLAELHFKRALDINPHNSTIKCHIGVVQNALKKVDQALQTLNKAIEADPNNTLCKFHRASINFNSGRHAEALVEFEELKNIAPKESLVYFSIGNIHKKLGNTHLALMYFNWATDLDPKGINSQIKEAISSPGQSEDESLVTQSEEPTQHTSTECEASREASGESSNVAVNATIETNAEDSDDSL